VVHFRRNVAKPETPEWDNAGRTARTTGKKTTRLNVIPVFYPDDTGKEHLGYILGENHLLLI